MEPTRISDRLHNECKGGIGRRWFLMSATGPSSPEQCSSETTEAAEPVETAHLSIPMGVLVLLAGGVLGLFGGFLQAVAPRIGGVPIPVGAVLVVATLVACIRALIHHYDSRRPGVLLLLGWLVVSVALALPWPGGDVVIGQGAVALGYLFGGVVMASAAANIPARLRPREPSAVTP
jgi:hypothetical protein